MLGRSFVQAARPSRQPGADAVGGNGLGSLERFNEQFSHLHVHPSTHRSALRRVGEPPALVVTFAIRSSLEKLEFSLPPGYQPVVEPGHPTSCGVFVPAVDANSSSSLYSRATGAQPLTPHITDCELSAQDYEEQPVRLTLHICEGVRGLSAALRHGDDSAQALVWWFFHLRAWNPDESPPPDVNLFEMQWAALKGATWTGSTTFQGWPVLGDWDCAYSDWEGWGACSARCGGGLVTLRRRILTEPPLGGLGQNCTEALERQLPCNEHPCLWPCEFVEEQRGECTAECGGGIRLVRGRWRGQHCPDVSDNDAVRREVCNTQPCRSKCRLSDTWTTVTECSELCGPGHFWLLREVLQKDAGDALCQPQWRRLPCLRQRCTPLTVLRPDRNIVPFPDDTFEAAVLFKVPIESRIIQLNAPEGYKFGELGDACNISEHDMHPHFNGCQVGVRASQAVLRFATPLPPTLPGEQVDAALENASDFDDRRQFKIKVVNAPCSRKDWVPDLVATTLTCSVSPDGNRWTMEFAEEGTTRWESLSSEGYALYAPFAAEAVSFPPEKEMPLAGGGEQVEGAEPDEPRFRFCSKRLPCKGGVKCGRDGVCLTAAWAARVAKE